MIRVQPTHCPEGHAYDEANTYHSTQGKRQCRECRRRRQRALQRDKRAALCLEGLTTKGTIRKIGLPGSSARLDTLHCNGCDRWMPDSAFYRHRSNHSRRGRAWPCIECAKRKTGVA